MLSGNDKPGNVTLCELAPAVVAMVSATGYSKGTGAEVLHTAAQGLRRTCKTRSWP